MANKVETSEELNSSKPTFISHQTKSPLSTSILRKLPSSLSSKGHSYQLAPLKDIRSPICGEKGLMRSSTQFSFSIPTEGSPIVGSNSNFGIRKKTFESFLKEKDLELLMGEQNRLKNSKSLEQSVLSEPKLMHPGAQIEIKQSLKKREGKMYTNELWSMGYYTTVVNSSNLKKRKIQHTANSLLKQVTPKESEQESPSILQRSKSKNNSCLIIINPCPDSNQSLGDNIQLFESISLQPSPTSSPIAIPKGGIALKSILRNITPTKGTAVSNDSPPSNEISVNKEPIISTDLSPSYLLSEANRNSKGLRPHRRSQTLQFSFEKKCDDEGTNITMEGRSSISFNKSKTIFPGKFFSAVPTKVKTPSRSTKNSRRDMSEEGGFLDVSYSIRHDSGQNFPSKSIHTSTENVQARLKMQLLINQCIDLGQKNKNLEKEVLTTKANLEAFSKRRQIMKLQLKKTTELSEALRKMRVRHRQGAS